MPVRLMGLRGYIMDLQAALKKYQTEQRSKGDALDKCQAELKKLRKKSQGSKNPQKYSDKELQVGLLLPAHRSLKPNCDLVPSLIKEKPIYLCAYHVSVKGQGRASRCSRAGLDFWSESPCP